MSKIIMTKGLPASGKTTWAKEFTIRNNNTKRINKDDLRGMIDDGRWSRANETFILQARNVLIRKALHMGHDVIVDDTNLAPKHETELRKIADDEHSVFEIKDFTDVPLESCLKMDQKRSNYVGEKVIRGMYNQFLKPAPEVVEWVADVPMAIMCDLDGTLCLFGDANPYERDFLKDKINVPVWGIVGAYTEEEEDYEGHQLILVSGRSDKFRKQTEEWLENHAIQYDALYMREDGDSRKDSIVKEEIYREHILGKYNISFVLDDRDQVVELWRSLGLTCLQVAEGEV